MRRSRPLTAMALLGVVAGTVAVALLLACGDGGHELRVGAPAPAFALPALEGGEVDSRSLRGQPVVVNFWATWCQPCLKEIPVLAAVARRGEAQVVGVALDHEGAEPVRRFVAEHGIPYPVLLGDEAVFRRFGGLAIPHTVVVDAEGVVVAIHRGLFQPEELQAALARARAGDAP